MFAIAVEGKQVSPETKHRFVFGVPSVSDEATRQLDIVGVKHDAA